MDQGMNPLAVSDQKGEISSAVVQTTTLKQQQEFEKNLRQKCDLHVLPILCLLYACIFLDRANIGNARIQGLESDLDMTGTDFSIALMVFFITYIPLEIPANLLMRKLNPNIWLSSMTFACGVITICEGITESYAGLVVCRLLLGAFEAGFAPGCLFLISSYYGKYELQWRTNIFLSAALISVAFGGLLAYAIGHLEGVAGYAAWRWIFIIEGLFTVIVSISGFWLMPDWPEKAKFLSEPARNILTQRSSIPDEKCVPRGQPKSIVIQCLTDVKIWIGSILYFCMLVSSYSTAYFVPTILKDLGWVSSRAQIMSIPIWVSALIVALCTSALSDRFRRRLPFVLLGCLLCGAGYVVILSTTTRLSSARYFALYLVTIGIAVAQPTILVWQANIVNDDRKRGVAVAIQVAFGNCGGILASNIWLQSQAPAFPLGYGIGLGFIVLMAFTAIGLGLYLQMNKRSVEREEKETESLEEPSP